MSDANILDERHVNYRFPKQRVSILDVPKWWRGVLFLSWSILFFLSSPWVNYWHGTVMLRSKRRFKVGRFQKQRLNTKLRCMIRMLTRKREERGWKMLQANGPVGSVNYSPHFHSSMIVVGFCYSPTFCPLCFFFISFIFKFKSTQSHSSCLGSLAHPLVFRQYTSFQEEVNHFLTTSHNL